MRNYFCEFDDSLHNPPRMNSQIWFHRVTKTPCQICRQTYRPHLDRQHHCGVCQEWYHLHCLGVDVKEEEQDFEEVPNPGLPDFETLGEDGLPAIFKRICDGPTVRGHGGEYDWANNWLNTGSGVQIGLIEDWRNSGRVPEDWLKMLGENFVEDFVMGKVWKWYSCPVCGGQL